MASVFMHSKSPYWFSRWKDEKGTWRNKSTKVPARPSFERKAWLVALKWEEDAQRLRQGDFLRHHVEEGSRQIAERVFPTTFRKESGRAFFTSWLADKQLTTSGGTVALYTSIIQRFLVAMGDKADKPLASLSVEDG